LAQALNNGAAPLFQGAYGPEFNEEKYPKDTNDNDPATTMLPWRKYIFVNEDGEEYIPKKKTFQTDIHLIIMIIVAKIWNDR
jgi:hypothetical protein